MARSRVRSLRQIVVIDSRARYRVQAPAIDLRELADRQRERAELLEVKSAPETVGEKPYRVEPVDRALDGVCTT
jgi:hypothetical protein